MCRYGTTEAICIREVRSPISTCIDGDLKVSGVLKNGNDEPYITQQDHDDDITTLTDIITDFQDAIQTNSDGTNTIPDGAKLAYESQLTPLQTTIDTFQTSKADTSSIYTQQHINDTFQTVGDKGVVVLHQFFDFYLFSEGPHGARLPCFWSQSLVRGVLPRSP